MLKEIGQAIVDGKNSQDVTLFDPEPYLGDRAEALAIRDEAAAFCRGIESAFDGLYERLRPIVIREMRRRGIKDSFGSSRAFMEQAWVGSPMRTMLANVMWRRFNFPGEAPLNVIDACEPWRILVDAEGVAYYERAVAKDLPRRVQWMDLIQLTYLGLSPRRMIVSGDKGLLRAADAIFATGYRNARAVNIANLI